jgi:hypothetical protein
VKVDVRIKMPLGVAPFFGTFDVTKNTLKKMVPQEFCTWKVALLHVEITIKNLPM